MPTILPPAAPFGESLGTALAWAHPAVSVLSGAGMKTQFANTLTGVGLGTKPRGHLLGLRIEKCFDALCAQDVHVYPLAASNLLVWLNLLSLFIFKKSFVYLKMTHFQLVHSAPFLSFSHRCYSRSLSSEARTPVRVQI